MEGWFGSAGYGMPRGSLLIVYDGNMKRKRK